MTRKLLDPTLDLVFKALLVKNAELLRDMIEAVLRPIKPIRDIHVLNPDIPKDYPGDKAIVLDVRVRLDDGGQIDLEMQSTVPTGTAGRFLYYWARDFVDTMRSGDDYTGLCPCISIEMHLLELPKLTLAPLERQARLERWARFFRADTPAELERLAAEDPIMSTAVHTLENISSDPEMQRQAREREDAQLMLRHLVLAAAKESEARGEAKGKAEGIIEGKAEGIIEGKAEGIIEGKAEGQRDSVQLVCRMLRIQLTAAQERRLAALDADGLDALLAHLEEQRRLPDEFETQIAQLRHR